MKEKKGGNVATKREAKNGNSKRETRQAITVSTTPSGYSLTVGNSRYLYFGVEELLAGFIYHVGFGERDYKSNEFVSAIVDAAAAWKSGGNLVKKEADKVVKIEARLVEEKRAQRLLLAENRRLKDMLRMKGVDVYEE